VLTNSCSHMLRTLCGIVALALAAVEPATAWAQASGSEPQLDKAIAAFERSDFSGAGALVQNYLIRHPQDAAAWNLKGLIDDSQKDYAAGGKDFETALRFSPSASVYTNLGNHFLLVHQPAGAKEAFSEALRLDPHHFSARFNLLNLALNEPSCRENQGNQIFGLSHNIAEGSGEHHQSAKTDEAMGSVPDCARQALELIKGFSPPELKRPEVSALQVRALLAAGRRSDAVDAARRVISAEPGNSKLAYSLGIELAEAGDAPDAVPLLEHAESLLPAGQPDAQLLLDLCRTKFQAGQPAASDLLRLKDMEPGWWQPYYYLGLIAAREQRYMEAGSVLVKAQQLKPTEPLIAAALANVAAAQGFWFDAAEEWQQYLRLKPEDLRAYRELAIVAGVAHQQELAVNSMQRYLKAYPDDAEAYYMLALMEQDSGHNQEAIQALETCVRLKPDYAPGWATLARDEMNQGKLDPARENLHRALKIDPHFAPALVTLAEIENREGHPELALPLLQQAVKLDPTNIAAFYQLSLAERRAGHSEAAIRAAAAFEQLRKLNQRNPSGRGLIAYLAKDVQLTPRGQQEHYLEFLKDRLKQRPDDSRLLCRLGVAEISTGQTDSGLAHVRMALQPSLPYEDALATARALAAGGRDALALDFYHLASTLSVGRSDARAALGEAQILLAQGHPQRALDVLNNVPADAQPKGEAADLAGLIYARMGMNQPALAAFRVAIGLNPREQEFYSDAAVFLGSNGEWDAALKVLDLAKKQCGESSSLLIDEAVMLQLSGRREQAQGLLKKLAFNADDPMLTPHQRLAALLLGISYYTTDQKALAARIFQQLTDSDPRLALAWYYRALLAFESGKRKDAMDLVSRSLSIQPKNPVALYLRGKLLAEAGRLPKAEQDLVAAAEVDPTWSAPHYQLARLYRMIGKTDQAEKEANIVAHLDARAKGSQSAELRQYLNGLTLAGQR
jgi:tetratricopeptide (TPR) repeat protein